MACHAHHAQQQGGYPEQNYGPGAKWIKHLTQNRLGTFTGGHFADVNLTSILFTHRLDDDNHVKLQVWSAPGLTKPTFEEAMKQKFKPAKKGDSFGPSWTNHWWKVSVNIPSYWVQYERVQFEFDPGCEAMIYTTDGVPLQGITGGFGGDRRVDYIIPRDTVKKGKLDFIIESSCNGMFGVPWNGDTIAPPDMNRYFQLASADLVVPNEEAWRLMADFTTLREIVDTVPGNTPLQNQALTVANEIMNIFDKGEPNTVEEGRKAAEKVFGERWDKKGEKIYEEGPERPLVWGIGHCHIDTAWLWPYRVTQQKVARSWSTQVDLMERYPEHRFTCSQAQQYKWLEQLYPPLFDRVKEKVLSGQFHPVGGSWVENDSNMPSGEALARQFVFGQRYFESRFGKRCDTAWLPDSFGLTGALPQLIRLAGMKYFFTQKLSWNNINTFPHSTFNWVGIDGTQVLCHMTPVDTYTAQATVGDVNKAITNHKNLESNDTALLVFGNGDGGGGPLSKMLDNLRRIRATTNNHRELPPVVMGRSVEDFFDDVAERSNQGKTLPNWHGELYLEFHRGTYTSHGSIKKGNRKSEILLRDIEHVATLASFPAFAVKEYTYPKDKIDVCWEKVLLNQFHDVLPGSAIGMVYEDAEKLYAEVRKDGKALLEEAFEAILPRSAPATSDNLAKLRGQGDLVAVNTTFFARQDVVKVPLTGAGSQFKSQVVQTSKDGTGYALMECLADSNIALCKGLYADSMPVSVYTNGSGHFVLKNSSVQLTISGGRITSLLDVQLNRELIAKGESGGLVIFEDRPNYWDAWDVEIHHLEKRRPLEFANISVTAEGPLRASITSEFKYGQSTINVTISLDAVAATTRPGSRSMFTFDAVVDWHQRHEFLKFEVPLDIHNENAIYETQWGYVQRPTHKNTSWDSAKFEVCGHKYADLSEFGYGVALLSESKYGFSCLGNVLRISLLRGATAPDAEQDQGKHEFSWAVLPHAGHFLESDVPLAGYLFNSPLHVRYVPRESRNLLEKMRKPFTIEGARNVYLETIKRGDDDDFSSTDITKTIVLRLYEAFGGHAKVKLRVAGFVNVAAAYVTNLLEDTGDELNVLRAESDIAQGASINLDFHGFEVKTVKLVIGSGESALPEESSEKRDSWVSVGKP
ncbi:glycoside hydrolase family 38 protein [Gloeophyllum trabeum ATCC 11539]|uniref:Alpha-mannosidase n=1 Tax=Gloeophyllum trabeum (strain ATCC 11539 / FP-39264 / Madison 617) TaxID=670483 RepID=S7Q7X9_GLOTA|nr:glycoside hydrolase family 38 protein [Gloeophyllum trabeum ATCC 11539]EPQ55548.1 glycoside hydrolase family 38 protein [Gloeophyllum trabeum ATCC 11539]